MDTPVSSLSLTSFTHRLPVGLEPRRGQAFDLAKVLEETGYVPDAASVEALETLWVFYRTLCGVMYNFVPTSGHPGGSLSAGRLVLALLFETLDYDIDDPDRDDADRVIFAAGHKALGLYAAWALRDELHRLATGENPLSDVRIQNAPDRLTWEDLLGFRRNRTDVSSSPFRYYRPKPLDGHPTPLVPFVPIATGPSGVGVAAGLGVALALADTYGVDNAPRVHLIEGEGGMTPGRVQEALAAAGTLGLANVVMHVDWNQASIDSDRVCREGDQPGEYVQWNPMELGMLHDWNVIRVDRGMDPAHILAAQALAKQQTSGQPTMIVYRTLKGVEYGIEGRKSHGAGHAYFSEDYVRFVLEPFEARFGTTLPHTEETTSPPTPGVLQHAYWETLARMRAVLSAQEDLVAWAGNRLGAAVERLDEADRRARGLRPDLNAFYASRELDVEFPPQALQLQPGTVITLRETLGAALGQFNRISRGGFLGASADLLGSTSLSRMNEGFPEGYYHTRRNPASRLLAVGGICEDAIGGFMTGVSAVGHHVGVSSSYGAFIAALQHIAARVHAIGQQNHQERTGQPYRPYIMINGHAGVKTGEDGPTHADPQPLQLLQENFPRGTCITLVPWEPLEVWPLLVTAIRHRPAVIAPFVTRPKEAIPDREKLGLPPPDAAVKGVYRLVSADPDAERDGTIVLQGSEVAITFVQQVRHRLSDVNLDVYYVASAELFDLLPEEEKAAIFPESRGLEAMGITGFTLPTLYRWVTSSLGRRFSLYPFKKGHYLSSGKAEAVLYEAGLDGDAMERGIRAFLDARTREE